MVLVRKDLVTRGALVAQSVKNLPEMWETRVGSLGWKTPGEGNGLPLQYSCLENSRDRGALWVTVHGVTKSQTQLSDQHTSSPNNPERAAGGVGCVEGGPRH